MFWSLLDTDLSSSEALSHRFLGSQLNQYEAVVGDVKQKQRLPSN
jgi:hypothetical protein